MSIKQNHILPELKNVLYKGLITFFRGVKIGEEDIEISKSFSGIKIDKQQLSDYEQLFGFESEIPLTFLYLLAQRAQVALMLDKNFTIAIPGLIHVENDLELFDKIEINEAIELKSNVFVESKTEGSLKPIFEVLFYQNEVLVAQCKSTYIAKRKSKKKKRNAAPEKYLETTNTFEIKINQSDANTYAQISGDRNPIHASNIAAKLFGLESTIIHGWYLVSLVASQKEKLGGMVVEKLHCEFNKPVFLPSNIELKFSENEMAIYSNSKLNMIVNLG